MEEIRNIARACYNGAAGTEKELAGKLFQSLDANGDGKISLREYKNLMHSSFSNDDFFKGLDANCDGTLDFEEALALYYMDKVSVPRCSSCNSLLLHSYFSCLPCQTTEISCYLCCDCYGNEKFKHHHSSNQFIDTRAMLKLLDQILKHSKITSPQGVEDLKKLVLKDKDDDDDDDDKDEEYDDAEGEKNDTKGKAAEEGSNRQGRERVEMRPTHNSKLEKIARGIEVMNMIGGPLISTTGAIAVAATTCLHHVVYAI